MDVRGSSPAQLRRYFHAQDNAQGYSHTNPEVMGPSRDKAHVPRAPAAFIAGALPLGRLRSERRASTTPPQPWQPSKSRRYEGASLGSTAALMAFISQESSCTAGQPLPVDSAQSFSQGSGHFLCFLEMTNIGNPIPQCRSLANPSKQNFIDASSWRLSFLAHRQKADLTQALRSTAGEKQLGVLGC